MSAERPAQNIASGQEVKVRAPETPKPQASLPDVAAQLRTMDVKTAIGAAANFVPPRSTEVKLPPISPNKPATEAKASIPVTNPDSMPGTKVSATPIDSKPTTGAVDAAVAGSPSAESLVDAAQKLGNKTEGTGTQTETVSTQKTETAPQDDRSQKMEAYKAKLAKGEKITADENAEYQKLAKAEANEKRMGELKSQLEAGTDDPAVLAEYNKLAAEKNGETVPPTESEKVQQDMQAVIDRVVEQGDATTDDWADMAELYHRGTALNVDTTNLRREAATRLMESVKDPNKLLKMKELMATKEIQDMIQEVTSLTLQNRNLPRIQKEKIEQAKAQTKKVAEMKGQIKKLSDAAENDPQILAYNQERSILASLNNDVVQLKYAHKANKARINQLNLMIDVKLGTVSGMEAFLGIIVNGIDSFSSQAMAEMDALTNGTAQHEQLAIAA